MNRSESKYFNTSEKMCTAFFSLLEKKDYEYITVKEICKKANVNRSTFYLHYETMDDLLDESVEHKIRELEKYLSPKSVEIRTKILTCPIEQLDFITPEYLIPYLNYVKDNRRIFLLFMEKTKSLKLKEVYSGMISKIINPILERFQLNQTEKKYLPTFCISGLIGIISAWLETDCKESIETIFEFMNTMIHSIDLKKKSASE